MRLKHEDQAMHPATVPVLLLAAVLMVFPWPPLTRRQREKARLSKTIPTRS
jgi:hypothetical protein